MQKKTTFVLAIKSGNAGVQPARLAPGSESYLHKSPGILPGLLLFTVSSFLQPILPSIEKIVLNAWQRKKLKVLFFSLFLIAINFLYGVIEKIYLLYKRIVIYFVQSNLLICSL